MLQKRNSNSNNIINNNNKGITQDAQENLLNKNSLEQIKHTASQFVQESVRNTQRRSQSVVKVHTNQPNQNKQIIDNNFVTPSGFPINKGEEQQNVINPLIKVSTNNQITKIKQSEQRRSLGQHSGFQMSERRQSQKNFESSEKQKQNYTESKQSGRVQVQYDQNSAMHILQKVKSKEQLVKIFSNLSNNRNGSLHHLQQQLSGGKDPKDLPEAPTSDTVDQAKQKLLLINNQEYHQKLLDSSLIQKMAKLMLQVIDGIPLKPSELIINAHGFENIKGLRGQNDGIVHFGAKKFDDNQLEGISANDQLYYNDYLFDVEQSETVNYFGDRHFYIQYDYDANRYLLRDSGMGSGTFLKIQRDHILKSGQLISIGKDLNFLVVIDKQNNDESFVNENMFNENQEYTPNNKHFQSSYSGDISYHPMQMPVIQNISINFIENMLSKNDSSLLSQATLRRQHQFTQNDVPILIGRTQECKVRFKEGALSRLQCRIDFIDSKWIIRDGNGKDKQSTNGTWLWVSQPQQLMDDDIFKAGNAIFKVNYTQY
eukprot:403345826